MNKAPWAQVPGADWVLNRQGWYPTFHDATLIAVEFRPAAEDANLKIRLQLNEGGPMDTITLVFDEVLSLTVESWEDLSQVYFTGSEITKPDDGFDIALKGGISVWRIRSTALRIDEMSPATVD